MKCSARCLRSLAYIGFGIGTLVILLPYALLVTLAFHLFVVTYEEPHLRSTFGESYVAYCRRVPRWLPRVG